MKRWPIFLTLVLLAACAPEYLRWQPGQYRVQKGDTLYSIAFRYDLDYRELARWNGIGTDYLIYPGQALRLQPPGNSGAVAAPARPGSGEVAVAPAGSSGGDDRPRDVVRLPQLGSPAWRWPAGGTLVADYRDRNATGKGIDIGGQVGDPVMAAAAGHVVYSGSGLIGYGKLIIIKHNDEFLSAYGHNSELYVEEGAEVQSGDRIAAMGTGPNRKPILHFEIRRNGESVNPMNYLPER